jgi:hypothetical protein
LFARLGVFRAGCTLDALEAVCTSTLDALNALLDHGLVLREHEAGAQPRFRMLGVVREYALERLDDTGVAERHARYYHGLATRLGGQLVGPAAETAAAGLRDEHDNVLAALEWFVAHDVDAGFELVAATRVYWDTARRGRDVRDWLDRALSRGPERASRAYVDALIVHGRQLVVAGEYAGAERTLQRSAEIAEQIDARASVALARVYLAWLRSLHGDDAGIAALATAAVADARAAGDLAAERLALAMTAEADIHAGRHEDARPRSPSSTAAMRRWSAATSTKRTTCSSARWRSPRHFPRRCG